MSNELKAIGGLLAIGIAYRLIAGKTYNVTDYIGRTRRNGSYRSRSLDDIVELTIHHTATPSDWTPERIAKIHTDENGWPGIGYHFLIYNDGSIYQVNDLRTVSYHNGVNNSEAVGIAWVGNGNEQKPSREAINAHKSLFRKLRRQLKNLRHLRGHREKKSTSCPGNLIDLNYMRSIAKLTK